MPQINPNKINQLKAFLRKSLDSLQIQLELVESACETVDLDQSRTGRLTRMDAMQQQKMAQSQQAQIKARILKIQKALTRIAEDDYGFCEECGEEIPVTRLEVKPEAELCLACQSRQEYHAQS